MTVHERESDSSSVLAINTWQVSFSIIQAFLSVDCVNVRTSGDGLGVYVKNSVLKGKW